MYFKKETLIVKISKIIIFFEGLSFFENMGLSVEYKLRQKHSLKKFILLKTDFEYFKTYLTKKEVFDKKL